MKMMMNKTNLIFVTVFASLSMHANASCSTPTAPDAPTVKPTLPICMTGYKSTGTHTCSSSDADSHIDQVNQYMKTLSTYAADAITYANAV